MKVLTLKDFKYLIDNLFKNKTSLDKISESEEGVLLFDGEEISGCSGGGSGINDEVVSLESTYSSDKIEKTISGLSKAQTHEEFYYTNQVTEKLIEIVNINSLMNSSVIISQQVLVKNNSNSLLQLVVYENEVKVLDTELTAYEIQKYQLSTTQNIRLLCKGSFDLILYIDYL